MSKRFWFFIGLYLLILLVAGLVLFGKKIFPQPKVHYHAGFVVFHNDKKIDFSDYKYMNVKPCTLDEKEAEEEEDEQLEKAHLHDSVGDVVHVEATNATWKDLFTNLHYGIDYSKVTAFVNGVKVYSFADLPIRPYDSVVIFIGAVDENHLKEGVTKEHIVQAEKKSEDCGK